MTLWVCSGCSTAYAVGHPSCPQCNCPDHTEEGEMPKITKAHGATYGDLDESRAEASTEAAQAAPVADEAEPSSDTAGSPQAAPGAEDAPGAVEPAEGAAEGEGGSADEVEGDEASHEPEPQARSTRRRGRQGV